ncbi:MAG: sulfatase-like hydrolase/transferase [Phycisphaeraceae bacterium]
MIRTHLPYPIGPAFLSLLLALLLAGPAALAKDNFKPLFDGASLDGWVGDERFWRVEDGVIVADSLEHQPEQNTFLIWGDGLVDDFELKFRYRIVSEQGNSGVQIRSRWLKEAGDYVVAGYQPDIAIAEHITGMSYEERGRGPLARRGERTVIAPDGSRETTRFADEGELNEKFDDRVWTDYHVVARGNTMTIYINGHRISELVDDGPEARRQGILAFQLHAGAPMRLEIDDARLKPLDPVDVDPPNIVLILADDLGYGDLSSYGADDMQTPQIDRLVNEGLRMDHFYANSTVCSPTRAALLSGRYQELVGVPGVIRAHSPSNSWGYLDPHAVLLPQMLAEAGYHSALIGKWHLGAEPENHPNAHGFDYFHGWIGDMMDDYYDHRRRGVNFMQRNRETIDTQGTHATELFTDWAVDYVHAQAATDEPFFLFMSHFAPHFPIQPPDEWLHRVQEREGEIDDDRANNVALIEHMDHEIGRLMDALQQAGVAEDTLVIFTSDNGGSIPHAQRNGDLRGGKQAMYEGGIRVPFAAYWPGQIQPGSTSDTVALSMDLVPTLCRLAGVRYNRSIDGVNIHPSLLEGWDQEIDRDLFWVRREGNRYMGLTIWAARRGDWKLVKNSHDAPFELFDLANDPLETTNLADEYRGIYNELRRALRAHIQRGGAVPWQKHDR